MLQSLELSSLENRRSSNRLKRQVKVKISKIVQQKKLDRHISNNNRGCIVEHCKTEQLKHSFFVMVPSEYRNSTCRDRRALQTGSPSVLISLSPRCVMLNKPYTITQGRRRLLESGTAIGHRWCSPSADGTRGGGSRRGGVGEPPPRKFCNSR